jgi:hypothetical protein
LTRDAVDRQINVDRLVADGDFDHIEECLAGFLAKLRNDAVVHGIKRSAAWASALNFAIDMHHSGAAEAAHANSVALRLRRLESPYRQSRPKPDQSRRARRSIGSTSSRRATIQIQVMKLRVSRQRRRADNCRCR